MHSTSWSRSHAALLIRALVITVAVLWVFSPAFHGDWLWDDGLLIRQNDLVHDPEGLWKIWLQPGKLIDYLPVTVTAEWLEWHLFGGDTLGYHLVTVILHLISSFLVWHLLSRFNLRFAWLGGLLFAIHPVVVESVAWISELKNTLSLPPFLLAMVAWMDYELSGARHKYYTALALFLVAMLCKATMVMFPIIILIYAWWRRDRITWRDLLSCVPFLGVSLSLGIITIEFMHPSLGLKTVPLGGWGTRLALAGTTLAFYVSKSIFPLGLLPIYPRWNIVPTNPVLFASWPIVIGVIAWCWSKRRTWGRHVLLGLGFFLVNLAPFLGFNQAAYMSFTWVMDHILYIPLIGWIGIFIAGCGDLYERINLFARYLFTGVLTVILALLAWESHGYAAIFINQEALWIYDLRGNPNSAVAHNNLGLVFVNSGRLPQAIEQFNAALKLKPDYAFAQNGLGNALVLSGEPAAAVVHYRAALQEDPNYPEAHNGLANILLQLGHLSEAQAQCEQALKAKPTYIEAHCNLGLIFAQEGRFVEAVTQFEIAQRLDPADSRIAPILESLRAQEQSPASRK
jgi:Tfp pilus assembly protein PilF